MNLFIPDYYDQFHCIAASCPDSCCAQWQIDIDDLTASKYQMLSGSLSDRIRKYLRKDDYGVFFENTDGRCPMWRNDGLCSIHAQLGHDALCDTCRNYPRLRLDYGDFAELGLEMSCPEAARLIFTLPASYQCAEDSNISSVPSYDSHIMSLLLQSREAALSLLQKEGTDLSQSLASILLYAHTVQQAFGSNDIPALCPEELLLQAKTIARPANMKTVYALFESLDILTERWRLLLALHPENKTLTGSLKPLIRYLIHRYWLQAVDDLALVARVKFMITACLLINALGQDPITTSQLFSKEIENDPENLSAIIGLAEVHPALTNANLLGLLFAL